MKIQVRGAVCVAILCLASAAFAQQTTTQSETLTPGTAVSGSIVSVTNDVVVVRTDAGETMRFNRDATVTVPSSLMAGNRVTVEYNRITADNMRLTSIKLDGNANVRGTAATDDRTYGSTTTGNTTTGNTTTANTTTGTNTTTGYSSLPQTASPLVMWTIAGLALLGGALALRARRTS